MSSLFVDFNKKQLGITTLIMGAVMIVISLAWSNAITALIDNYVPQKYADSKNAWYKVIYALILTIMAGVIVNNF